MRAIDADALELILSNAIEMMRIMAKALDSEDDPEIQMEIKAYTDILTGVKEQPTIEPERKKGKWIEDDDGWDSVLWRCSECAELFCLVDGTPEENEYNFCPNCGTDMRGGER